MLLAANAASSALDMLLQSLSPSKSASGKPGGQKSADPFADVFGGTAMSGKSSPASGLEGFPQLSPATMSALLAAQGQSTTGSAASAPAGKPDLLKDLFAQLDADGNGQVTKSEFESALGAGGTNIGNADRVHSKLDADGDGAVSLDEMLSALTGGNKGPNAKALQNASSNSVINADGSTTTSYPDGSKVTTTSPGAAASRAATSSYNAMEHLIARQMQAFSSTSSAWMSA